MQRIPLFLFLLFCACTHPGTVERERDWKGWPEVWRIRGGGLEVVLSPAVGRMLSFGFEDGENLLWEIPENRGEKKRDPADYWSWPNPGGDWLWPMQQSEWVRLGIPAKWLWPPPALFADAPWTAKELGPAALELSLEIGAPLHLRMTRRFQLSDREPGVLRIQQRMQRTGPSDIPVTLWHITQMPNPRVVRFEVPEGTAFPGGPPVLSRTAIEAESFRREPGMWVFDPAQATQGKTGGDGRWIEAEQADWILRIEAIGGREGGTFPDKGCSLALVKGNGAPFVELETMSVERLLAAGEVLENELVYTLRRVAP